LLIKHEFYTDTENAFILRNSYSKPANMTYTQLEYVCTHGVAWWKTMMDIQAHPSYYYSLDRGLYGRCQESDSQWFEFSTQTIFFSFAKTSSLVFHRKASENEEDLWPPSNAKTDGWCFLYPIFPLSLDKIRSNLLLIITSSEVTATSIWSMLCHLTCISLLYWLNWQWQRTFIFNKPRLSQYSVTVSVLSDPTY
jgi:hypothetical protein